MVNESGILQRCVHHRPLSSDGYDLLKMLSLHFDTRLPGVPAGALYEKG